MAEIDLASSVRLLLRRPLILARDDPTAFAVLRRDAEQLQRWFAKNPGYPVRIDTELARLYKLPPPEPDATHPLMTRQGLPFNRHRYALLCLTLAVLEREEGQTDLAGLAEKVRVTSATGGHKPIHLDDRHERRAIVDVVRHLCDIGVLTLRDGDEAMFLAEQGNALYDISKAVILQLISAPRPPSLCRDPTEMRTELYPATTEGSEERARNRIMRRLLEEPVLYRADLPPDELDYLDRFQQTLTSRIREIGLQSESRKEGIAVLDPTDTLAEPRRFPGDGTVAQAALLLADLLAVLVRGRDGPFVSFQEIVQIIHRLKKHYNESWRKEYATEGGTERLAEEACQLLCEFGLLRSVPEGYETRPAIARFAAEYGIISLPRGHEA